MIGDGEAVNFRRVWRLRVERANILQMAGAAESLYVFVDGHFRRCTADKSNDKIDRIQPPPPPPAQPARRVLIHRQCTRRARVFVNAQSPIFTPHQIAERSIVISMSVCMYVFVRLFAIISSELHVRSLSNFCACYLLLWLGPPRAA